MVVWNIGRFIVAVRMLLRGKGRNAGDLIGK
jgi:hypothetical protein